jgi:hypothetical protein
MTTMSYLKFLLIKACAYSVVVSLSKMFFIPSKVHNLHLSLYKKRASSVLTSSTLSSSPDSLLYSSSSLAESELEELLELDLLTFPEYYFLYFFKEAYAY